MRSGCYIHYETLAQAIAFLVFCDCTDHGNGVPEFEHFAENDLQEPPDILSRLGVMTDKSGRRHCHSFNSGWTPNKQLGLIRHQGEPTYFDLVLALCFIIDWRALAYKNARLSKEFDPTLATDEFYSLVTKLKNTEEHEMFHAYAFINGCALLEALGLGSWTENAGFKVVYDLSEDSSIRVMDIYRVSRQNLAQKLGGMSELYPAV